MMLPKVIRALGLEPVPDVHNWQRWWSAKLDAMAIAVGSIAVAYTQLPPDWQAALPHCLLTALAIIGLVIKSASLVMRGVKQPDLHEDQP